MMTLLRNNAKNDIIRINQNQKPETAERASMKVDIISNEAAEKYEVRERTDDETEPGAVLFQGDCQEDCEDFCERYGHKFRFRKEVIHFPAKFLADVEKRANKVRAEMDEDAAKIGWKFGTHVTYRASAAWKVGVLRMRASSFQMGRSISCDAIERIGQVETARISSRWHL